ncbi:hypothetical protein Ciccas_003912 [Cichlidogyrus casuarinus]|uniref:Uncharacterized protein n=1 Tax=Cichlidogyrus casuarinus TaxID=1844966 RepID=A0ABD2QFA6_9PLAT
MELLHLNRLNCQVAKNIDDFLSFGKMYPRIHRKLSFCGKIHRALHLPPSGELQNLILQEYNQGIGNLNKLKSTNSIQQWEFVILNISLDYNLCRVLLHCTCPPERLFCLFNKPYLPLWDLVFQVEAFINDSTSDKQVKNAIAKVIDDPIPWMNVIICQMNALIPEWLALFSKNDQNNLVTSEPP